MVDVLFARQSYKHRSLPISAQRTVNCYSEAQPKDAKTPVAVLGVPGIRDFATAGTGPIRGALEMAGVPYFVSGTALYSVSSDGTPTKLSGSTEIEGNGRVGMAGNGLQVLIVNGAKGWTYTLSGTAFAVIGDTDFEAAATCAAIGGYFALDWKGTNKFTLSNLLDGTAYDALDFATAESSPDRVLAVANNNGVLLIFGEKTIEPWDHTGALSFPFQPFRGSTPDRGIIGAHALVQEDNTHFFAGNDLVFYRLNGMTPVPISTHAIAQAWEDFSTTSDAFCFSYNHDGHKFIVVTFPSASSTWVYDVSTNLWHERISWDPSGAEVRWRVNCAVEAHGKTLVGDSYSGKIGYLDHDTYTEWGDPIRMIAVAPPIHGRGLPVTMPSFELDVETGTGTATGQGQDPQWMLDWSDDGGRTWSTPQLWRGSGRIGEYGTRMQWDRLGQFYQRSLRIQITDPVRRAVIAARCPRLDIGIE